MQYLLYLGIRDPDLLILEHVDLGKLVVDIFMANDFAYPWYQDVSLLREYVSHGVHDDTPTIYPKGYTGRIYSYLCTPSSPPSIVSYHL